LEVKELSFKNTNFLNLILDEYKNVFKNFVEFIFELYSLRKQKIEEKKEKKKLKNWIEI
jgi:cell shape-determining protein MreC